MKRFSAYVQLPENAYGLRTFTMTDFFFSGYDFSELLHREKMSKNKEAIQSGTRQKEKEFDCGKRALD